MGIEIPDVVWQRAQAALYAMQAPEGFWRDPDDKSAGSSTVATAEAAECLCIIQSMLFYNDGCPCTRPQTSSASQELRRRLDIAMERVGDAFGPKTDVSTYHLWLAAQLAEDRTGGALALRGLCVCERAAMATGSRSLGGLDWYKDAAGQILDCQREDGSWGDVPRTALAITFLMEGRSVPLIGKLRIPGAVEQSPAGCGLPERLHRQGPLRRRERLAGCGHRCAAGSHARDAHHLYLARFGARPYGRREGKLRAYTDTGGTILLEAVCGNPEVRKWAEKFFAEVWPEWRLKPLPPEHGVFGQPWPMKTQRPELIGIDDGIATRIFCSPDDISCAWQTRSLAAKEYLFRFAMNLRYYASDGGPIRSRLWAPAAPPNPPAPPVAGRMVAGPKRALSLARLSYDDAGWMAGRNYRGFGSWQATCQPRRAWRWRPTRQAFSRRPWRGRMWPS